MVLRLLLLVLILLNLSDNVIGAWLYQRGMDPGAAIQIIYAKYLVVAVLFLGFLLDLAYGMKIRRYEWYGLLYLFVAALLSVAIGATHPAAGAGSRLYLYVFPVVIYFAGLFVGHRADFDTAYLTRTSAFAFLAGAAVFLVLNIVFGAVELWRDHLDYSNFILNAKGFTDDVVDGLHANFFLDFRGVAIARFVGSFGDSLALAYSGMILIVPAFYLAGSHRYLLCGLILIVVAASLTRAVFLFLPLSILIFWYFRERGFTVSLVAAATGLILVILFGDTITALSENSSTNGHVESINHVLDFVTPTTLFAGSLVNETLPDFEPGLINLLLLFGVAPFLLFMAFLRGIYLRNAGPGSGTAYISIVVLVGVLTLSVISSVFFATTSAWFAWFLAGFASKRSILLLPEPEPPGLPALPAMRPAAGPA